MLADLYALLFPWITPAPRFTTPVRTLELWGPGL